MDTNYGIGNSNCAHFTVHHNQCTFYYHNKLWYSEIGIDNLYTKIGWQPVKFPFRYLLTSYMKPAILRHPVFPWIHWHLQSILLWLFSLHFYFPLYLSLHFIWFDAKNKIWMLQMWYKTKKWFNFGLIHPYTFS